MPSLFLFQIHFRHSLKLNNTMTLKRCYKCSFSPSHMPMMEDMDVWRDRMKSLLRTISVFKRKL